MNRRLLFIAALIAGSFFSQAQRVGSTPEYIKTLTADWKGERLPDGRPKVSDAILERLKKVSMEEAWGVLRNKGYQNQYEGNWEVIQPDSVMTGRVVTAQYMPSRPDFVKVVQEQGKAESRNPQGGTNSWPIDVLVPGDVYVADGYGKIVDGTLIGDNLGNAIYARSGRGVIFYGSVRDQAGLSEIKGFNGWIKGQDPSYIQQMMLTSINTPIRIGRAIVCFPPPIRRRDHRCGPQRPHVRVLSRAAGPESARARASRRGRRGGGDGGIPPGISQFGGGLHREPPQPKGDRRPAPGRPWLADRGAAGVEFSPARRTKPP